MPGKGVEVDFRTLAVLSAVESAAVQMVKAGAEKIVKATEPFVPEDTGELINSVVVEVNKDTATITYQADHAAVVHERMDVHHPKGSAKYLDKGIRAGSADALRAMEEELERGLR